MEIRKVDAEYLLKVITAIQSGQSNLAPFITLTCPECEETPEPFDNHIVYNASAILIGCEGYHVIDPNLLGIDSPNWQNWIEEI